MCTGHTCQCSVIRDTDMSLFRGVLCLENPKFIAVMLY